MAPMSSVDDIYSGDINVELETACTEVLEQQDRLLLLKRLKSKGLCTRDVLSFMTNQADLRSVNKELDQGISSRAMKAKVADCIEVLISKKQRKSKAIKRYLSKCDNKRFRLRKAITKINKKIAKERDNRNRKNEKKIEKDSSKVLHGC